MKFTPRKYQERAIRWILENPHCGLFMEMGLGKSVCTLTAIQLLADDLRVGAVLVIAPPKVAETTWSDEVEKWDHLNLRVSLVRGTPAKRLQALADEADVYVLGRDLLQWLAGLPDRRRFDMIVIDELTSFKHSGTKRFKSMKQLRKETTRVVGLTGTPAPNGLLDLWGQLYCIDGGERLGPFVTRYRDKWFHSIIHNNIPIKVWPKEGAEEAITERISDICFTMRAEEYIELPGIRYQDVMIDPGEKVMRGYREFERERVAEFREATESESAKVVAQNAAALVNKLAQYANGCVYDEGGKQREIHTAKIDMLFEMVERSGSPVLCFYAFRHDLTRILAAAPKGLRARQYLDGRDLRDWNNGKIDLLLAHPSATAYGLNMQQGGHTIIWFSTGWNLELYQQANARLYRQGQTKAVQIYHLIGRGTVDERMVAALSLKDVTQRSVIQRLAIDLCASHPNP